MSAAPEDKTPRTGTVRESLRRNTVALISLAVAVFSTSYNTWRNQTTESHRNVREASFKLLEECGELQQLTHHRYYGGDHSQMNWIAGWGKATLIRDMSPLVSPAVQARADRLFAAWKENASELERGEGNSEQAIESALDEVSISIREELLMLR